MTGRRVQSVREVELPIGASLWSGLAALADPVRLRILVLLREREQCVCHLTESLGLSQGTVSHHVRIMKRAGLVRDRRDSRDNRWVYYRLDPVRLAVLAGSLGTLLDTSHMDPGPAACGPETLRTPQSRDKGEAKE